MSIEIITDFDGACPHGEAGVIKNGANNFTLYPGYRAIEGVSEENPKHGGSRFYTGINNAADREAKVTVIADWEIAARTIHHDMGYLRFPGGKWQFTVAAPLNSTQFRYDIIVPPGITELALFPEYNYETCRKFCSNMKTCGVEVEVIGQSEDNRDIWMFNLPSTNPFAENFFLQARDHAYETAGSYCVEGIIDLLLSQEPLAFYLRNKFNFHIIPMTNPDGVFRGMSRLSHEQGADLNRVHTVADKAHAALKAAIDRVQPKVHMNIHNWTNKFIDGLLANDDEIAEKILKHFPDDTANYKRWEVETHSMYMKKQNLKVLPERDISWKNYCKDNFAAYGVNFEFPWFGILPEQMRVKGRKALTALALAAIEEMDS